MSDLSSPPPLGFTRLITIEWSVSWTLAWKAWWVYGSHGCIGIPLSLCERRRIFFSMELPSEPLYRSDNMGGWPGFSVHEVYWQRGYRKPIVVPVKVELKTAEKQWSDNSVICVTMIEAPITRVGLSRYHRISCTLATDDILYMWTQYLQNPQRVVFGMGRKVGQFMCDLPPSTVFGYISLKNFTGRSDTLRDNAVNCFSSFRIEYLKGKLVGFGV